MTQTKLYLIDIPYYNHLVHLEQVVEKMNKSKKWTCDIEDHSGLVCSNSYTYDKTEYDFIKTICELEERKNNHGLL